MATYLIPTDAVAVGSTAQQAGETVIHPTSLPISDFLVAQGHDPADAVITITIDDQYIVDDEDLNGDGTPDPYIPDNTPLASFEIDADGDGTADYHISGHGAQASELSTNNQYSGNVASFSGGFNFIDAETGQEVDTVNGTVFISTDGTFTLGEVKPVVPLDNGGVAVHDLTVICFTRGTLIATPAGQSRIEDLQVGDLVETLDRGPQPIRWISSRKIKRAWLAALPRLRPVRIPAGTLGDGYPEQDLLVSPQHRIALSSPIIRRMFDQEEVLVAAKQLIGYRGIAVEETSEIEYFHFMLDQHALVWANGALTETMLAGPMALKALGPEQCRELVLIFPEIEMPDFVPAPARRILKRHENKQVLQRHRKNGENLYAKAAAS